MDIAKMTENETSIINGHVDITTCSIDVTLYL